MTDFVISPHLARVMHLCLLLGLSSILASIPGVVGAAHYSPTFTATFYVHYPNDRVCPGCYLNFATSLNWTNYYPENGLSTTFRAYPTGTPDVYEATVHFGTANVGKTYVATVYYSAWQANETGKAWLNANCRNVLNNLSGNNKGREITFTLPDNNVAFDVYPNFCYNEGKVYSYYMTSEQLGGINKTIYYYVPGSLLDNPIARPVNYLLQGDGFAIEASMKTVYDFAISNGQIPETIVFGVGQGTDTNPWVDGGLEREYETTPMPCFVFAGGPGGCAPRTGGGFAYLDFLMNDVLPSICEKLSLPPVGRDMMAISGYSNGGLDACYFGVVSNQSLFSKVYCGSAAVWYNDNVFANAVREVALDYPIKLFMDVGGREDSLVSDYVPAAYQALLSRREFVLGSNLMFASYADGPDSHQWNSWASHTPIALAFLYNNGESRGLELDPLVSDVGFYETTRPFAIGTTLRVPVIKSQQSGGAIPAA